MDLPLAVGIGDLEFLGEALQEAGGAVIALHLALEAAHHRVRDRRTLRFHPGRNAGRQDLQQRGEGLLVAVVRGRGQEQPVGEVRGQLAHQLGLLGVDRVHLLGRGRGHVVGLVQDEQVERARIAGTVGRQDLVQQALGLGAAQPRQADDGVPVGVEGVGGAAVLAAHGGGAFGVDDGEVQAELLGHLLLPLQGQARRAHDHDALGAVTQQEFLGDQPGLDGLTQADIVGEQEVDAGCVERAGDRFELVVLDRHPGAERCLEVAHVGG